MKTSFLYSILFCLLLCVCACEDQNPDWYGHNSYEVSVSIGDSLQAHFPNAQYIEWEAQNDYYVASFRSDGYEIDAWFTLRGVWCMTETEVSYKILPDLVKNQINEVNGKIEDISKIERPHFCIQYQVDFLQMEMLCLETGQRLLYNADIEDAHPIEIPETVLSKLKRNYPDFKIALANKINHLWDIMLYTNYNLEHLTINDLGEIINTGE